MSSLCLILIFVQQFKIDLLQFENKTYLENYEKVSTRIFERYSYKTVDVLTSSIL